MRVGHAHATLAAIGVVIASLVAYAESASRAHAERVIRAIESYKTLHRQYPETLEQVGFKTETHLVYFIHDIQDNAPALFYPGLLPFSMNEYEFEKRRWTYMED
jgi:hypothetical protein